MVQRSSTTEATAGSAGTADANGRSGKHDDGRI